MSKISDGTLRAFRAGVVAAAIAFALSAGTGVADKPDQARQFVQRLSTEVIDVLAEGQLSHGARQERIRQLLIANIDIKTVGRAALGRYWRKATDDQLARYRSIYPDYILASYGSLLRLYSSNTLKLTGSQPVNEREALVKGELERADSPPIRMVFRVRRSGDRFKLLDVHVEGISMLLKQRSEFASVIRHEGMDGFLERLEKLAHRPVSDL